MNGNFAPSLKCVLVHEGGLDDDPRDPGGRTAYGVIQRRYNQYRKMKGLPAADVWKITPAERTEIYDIYYWRVVRGDDLPAGLDYVVFDACVNSGDRQAALWLQRALNDIRAKSGQGPIAVDGRIGDGTINAAKEIDDVDAVIGAMQVRRLAMLRNLKTWPVYGKGWARRVEDVKKLGQAVAYGSVPLTPPPGWARAPGKALESDMKPLPSPTNGLVGTVIGTGTTGVSSVTANMQVAQGISPTYDTILHALIFVGVALGIIGGLYAYWATSRAKRMSDDMGLSPAPVPAPAEVAA